MQLTAEFMTHVTCRLTAKNRDQLRNSTLGNRVWATLTFLGQMPAIVVFCWGMYTGGRRSGANDLRSFRVTTPAH